MERLSASQTSSLAPEKSARLCLNEGAVGVVKPIIRPSRDPCLTPVASYSPPHAEGRTSADRQLQDGAGLRGGSLFLLIYFGPCSVTCTIAPSVQLCSTAGFSQPAVTGTFSGNSGCVMAEHWGYITAMAAACPRTAEGESGWCCSSSECQIHTRCPSTDKRRAVSRIPACHGRRHPAKCAARAG